MKKAILMSAVLLMASTASTLAKADTVLVKDGRSNYQIVLPKGSSPSEHRAAAELKEHIRLISGATLPIVSEKTGPSILIGGGAAPAGVDLSGLGDEGFVIKTIGEDLVIAGGRLRGTMYGVYGFLEDVLGCRWYSAQVSKIPKMRTIAVPALDIRETPAFEYREPFFTEAWDKDWAARNRVNGQATRLDRSTGGKITYYPFVHTFFRLVPVEKYGESHPEYFSLVDGKRVGGERSQLCLTNPDVLRIATETLLQWIDEHPEAKIYSVSENDCGNQCQCENCKAVDEEEGSPSGAILRFVNAIAAEVAKKHPDKLIDTLAYGYSEKPPKITKPADNVRVRMCPIGACQAHPYEKCPKDASVVSNLKAWHQITDNLYIWHYNISFGHYLIPFPDFEELGADADMYHRNGVKGVFWQGDYSSGGGGEFAELRSWVLAKLSWNTKADWSALVDDFMNGYYGKAAPYIRQYFDMLHKEVRGKNIHFNCGLGPKSELFSPKIIAESVRLLDRAEKAAKDDEALDRVRKVRLGIDYVRLMQPIEKKETKGREKELLAGWDPFTDHLVETCLFVPVRMLLLILLKQ